MEEGERRGKPGERGAAENPPRRRFEGERERERVRKRERERERRLEGGSRWWWWWW